MCRYINKVGTYVHYPWQLQCPCMHICLVAGGNIICSHTTLLRFFIPYWSSVSKVKKKNYSGTPLYGHPWNPAPLLRIIDSIHGPNCTLTILKGTLPCSHTTLLRFFISYWSSVSKVKRKLDSNNQTLSVIVQQFRDQKQQQWPCFVLVSLPIPSNTPWLLTFRKGHYLYSHAVCCL